MRGARVEVRNGSETATGRLLSVEKERKANGKGDFYDATEFSIVSDTGEMKRTSISTPAHRYGSRIVLKDLARTAQLP